MLFAKKDAKICGRAPLRPSQLNVLFPITVSLLVGQLVGGKRKKIKSGNRTEWSPIRSVIIQVINKIR